MYKKTPLTQELLADFCDNVYTDLIIIKEDAKLKNDMITKLNEQLIAIDLKIETNKIISNEKNENIHYKLSVINEKMIAVEQKMNDLNKIMMKHFAYNQFNKKNIQVPNPLPNINPFPILNSTPIVQVLNPNPNPFNINPTPFK